MGVLFGSWYFLLMAVVGESISVALKSAITAALGEAGVTEVPAEVHLDRTARLEHGDWYSNVALSSAKAAGKQPRALAESMAELIMANPPRHVRGVEVAGPGFLNFRLDDGWLHDVLATAVSQGTDNFAKFDIGKGEKAQIEFVSANPTGPLHVGNGWLCSYGDTLARLMERCGWSIWREYYVNDTGGQIRKLGESLLARVAGQEVPEEGYQGDYVADLARSYPGASALTSGALEDWRPGDPVREAEIVVAGRWAAERILGNIRFSLERLGIHFDEWFSQASVEEGGAVAETIAELRSKGLVYEQDGATWLSTSELGDTRDRVLVKSSGDATYLAGDIAYHRNKLVVREFDRVIDVWGADHHGQVASLTVAMKALGVDPSRLEFQLGQMVSLAEGRMSKRAGNFISLDSLLDDIGTDAFRLLSLSKSINESTVLDLELVRKKSMDNPVYYVQYAHARIASIVRVAAERGVERIALANVDLSLLTHERELELIRCISELEEVLREACERREPFKITNWVRKLADRFHGFYHDCYVMGDGISEELTQARLTITEGARVGLAIGLYLLGVDAPEAM